MGRNIAVVLAVLATTVVAVAPVAGAAVPAGSNVVGSNAAGSVTAEERAAGETTTHRFALSGPFDGRLDRVRVDYRSAVGLDDATVFVRIDRGGDGTADERALVERVEAGDGSLEARLREDRNVTADDRVLVAVRGVENPERVGDHRASVGATVDVTSYAADVGFRVTPFTAENATFREVRVPGSTFARTEAVDTRFDGARLVDVEWRETRFWRATLVDVRGTGDAWTGVTVRDATVTEFRTERTRLADVAVVGSALADARSTDDRWRHATVEGTLVDGLDSRESTYDGVRFEAARVTDLTVRSSDLDGVVVRPGDDGGSEDGPRLDASDDAVDDRVDALRGREHAPGGTLQGVTLRDATLRNVTLANSSLREVELEEATFRNVTFRNVTLRGVTITDANYEGGVVADEVITSESELARELLVDDGVDDEGGDVSREASDEVEGATAGAGESV